MTLKYKLILFCLAISILPLAVTGVAQMLFPASSNASLIKKGDVVVGSRLIGQFFVRPDYFHSRPSATDPFYDASASGASNLAPSNAKLLEQAQNRVRRIQKENGLPAY